jgi:N-acetylmuramoyl-L-alanine amidase
MSTAVAPAPGWRRHARLVQLACVPVVIALVGTAAVGRTTTIRVRSGDTLSGIAVSHHTTVNILRELNHIAQDDDLIQIGQRLLIPAAAPAVKVSTPVAKPVEPTTKIVTYLVHSGDTLTAIAAHFKVAMSGISARNHLRSDGMIFIGQRLQIQVPVPVKAPTSFAGRTYPPATLAAAARARVALAAHTQPTPAQARVMIVRTAKSFGLDPALALAIGWQESGFQQRVVSPADAIGIMQVVPSTGDYISTYLVHRHLDLLNPADNITAGVALLSALTKSARIDKAVAGYYQGLGSVLTRGMFADTKVYVASVLHLRKVFAS